MGSALLRTYFLLDKELLKKHIFYYKVFIWYKVINTRKIEIIALLFSPFNFVFFRCHLLNFCHTFCINQHHTVLNVQMRFIHIHAYLIHVYSVKTPHIRCKICVLNSVNDFKLDGFTKIIKHIYVYFFKKIWIYSSEIFLHNLEIDDRGVNKYISWSLL